MNENKQLGGALCAAEGIPTAAEAAQAAPAEGKKEYVPPRMQVIPLGPQRLLATSGASGEPVQVYIRGGFSYYSGTSDRPCWKVLGETRVPECLLTTPFLGEILGTQHNYGNYSWELANCFWNEWRTVSFGPGGEDWNEADFLANVSLGPGSSTSLGDVVQLVESDPRSWLMSYEG